MPALSKSQQRLFGMVHAIQKGDVKPGKFSKKIREMAKRVDPGDARDFASTKTKGLPEKKKDENSEKKAQAFANMFVKGFLKGAAEQKEAFMRPIMGWADILRSFVPITKNRFGKIRQDASANQKSPDLKRQAELEASVQRAQEELAKHYEQQHRLPFSDLMLRSPH